MSLLEFLGAPGNLPFSISGAFLLLLLLVEILGVLAAGAGVTHLLDALDGKNHHVELGEFAGDMLGYLHWGKVPMIVLISALTGLFSLSGFGLQSLTQWIAGGLLPSWLASIPAAAIAVVGTHVLAAPLARLMPSDRGDAMREKDLLGMVGTVTMGPVFPEHPGEARVRDLEGRVHLVRIETSLPVPLVVGTEIVLVGLEGPFYQAQKGPSREIDGSAQMRLSSSLSPSLPVADPVAGTDRDRESTPHPRNRDEN